MLTKTSFYWPKNKKKVDQKFKKFDFIDLKSFDWINDIFCDFMLKQIQYLTNKNKHNFSTKLATQGYCYRKTGQVLGQN